MDYRPAVFKDRTEAGQKLAEALESYRSAQPLVLGLPRGGVVVAYEVVRALHAPLDVLVARKLGAPFQPELAIGAVAPGGVVLIQARFGLTDREIGRLVARERAEMERRLRRYRGGAALPEVKGRTVILVDDGLATGLTAEAALASLRKQAPRRIVLAVPVAAPEAAAELREQVDDFVCLSTPPVFFAIGQWYQRFEPVQDEQVVALLEAARRALQAPGAGQPADPARRVGKPEPALPGMPGDPGEVRARPAGWERRSGEGESGRVGRSRSGKEGAL